MFNYGTALNPTLGLAPAVGLGSLALASPIAGLRCMSPLAEMQAAGAGDLATLAAMNQLQDGLLMSLVGIMAQLMVNDRQQSTSSSDSSSSGPDSSSGVSGSTPPNLSADGQKQAQEINSFLQSKGSPAASQNAGELAVKYGQMYQVDPRILIAIAGQETEWGKTGIGVNGMLGVGAYDSDPNNATRNSHFSGVEQQLKVGAETFAKLREKGGSGPNDPIEKQIQAVGNAGWASDKGWAAGVTNIFHQISGQIS